MKKTDYQLIGYIGMALGLLSLVGGLFASFYYEVHQGLFGYTWVDYPYAKYSGSLLVIGVVLLVIGSAFEWRAYQEEKAPPKLPE